MSQRASGTQSDVTLLSLGYYLIYLFSLHFVAFFSFLGDMGAQTQENVLVSFNSSFDLRSYIKYGAEMNLKYLEILPAA